MPGIKAAAAAVMAALAIAGCEKSAQDEVPTEDGLHIYTWADYIDPMLVEKFEQEHNCRVFIDTFNSNESMYASLKPGGAGYDIITPSSYFVARMAKAGLIQKLDISRVPNFRKNFDQSFTTQLLDPTFTYNIPYAVTYTGFCYSKRHIPAGKDIATWAILGDGRFKNRITLLDDIREVIGAGLMSLGYSVNSVNPDEIAKAVDVVLGWCRNIKKFDSESYKTEVASGSTWIGLGYSTDAKQLIHGDEDEEMPPHPEIAFVLPKEGFTIAFDEMVLCAASAHPDLAYAFMNYIYEGEVAKANMEYIIGAMPVKPGIDALGDELRSRIIPPPEVLANGQVLDDIDAIPGAMEIYNKAWEKIKAVEPK